MVPAADQPLVMRFMEEFGKWLTDMDLLRIGSELTRNPERGRAMLRDELSAGNILPPIDDVDQLLRSRGL